MHSEHYLPRSVPEPLRGLVQLAQDLRWSWYHGHDRVWRAVDADLWQATANPWLILESISDQRLQELAVDAEFLALLQAQLAEREEHFTAPTWFSQQYGAAWSGWVPYFSLEFGLSESLPIYSGGLGVLAGDLLKTASDLGVPVIGIGLLYQQGYFRQALDADGEQIEFYPYNDPTMLPLVPLRDDSGQWVRVPLPLPGRVLNLRAWSVRVGRRSLFLLDSNDPLNNSGDRGITSELYGGGRELRLQQEMVLGIGGWRLLDILGIQCPACHLNEGHAAFAVLERARQYMVRHGCDFHAALCATRAGNLFTSHTPVAAGFDYFSPELLHQYLDDYVQELGISFDEFMALGRNGAPDAGFNMTWLAVRGAGAVNGVSRLHGEVSRRIFQPLFPRWPQAEIPVDYVTNGVHMPSWDSAASDALWTQACGKGRWRGDLDCISPALMEVSDQALWQLRCESRRRLVGYLAVRLDRQHRGHHRAAVSSLHCRLDPDALILGLARRFAEYKRPDLLLHDPERLLRLVGNRDCPVQIVVAGKAHPRDETGQDILRRWYRFAQRPEVAGKVVFVEDYDMVVAAELVRGVDVWLNTPRRPWEACGTSGMKVLVNGGLNLSSVDGWWAEAYDPQLGWAIGDSREHDDLAAWDARDAEQLYQLLEDEVVPQFYRRDDQGLPVDWARMMRESMARLTTAYSSNRMLREYTERFYVPMARRFLEREASSGELCQWQRNLAEHWEHIHFGKLVTVEGEEGYRVEVQVYLNELEKSAVAVEMYADGNADEGLPVRRCILAAGEPLVGANNAYTYRGTVPADRPLAAYTPRVIPSREDVCVPLEANFILWHH